MGPSQGNRIGEGSLPKRHLGECFIEPLREIRLGAQSFAPDQVVWLPDRNRGQVQFIVCPLKLPSNIPAHILWGSHRPDPNARVERQFHFLAALQPSKAPTRPTMSPEISSESFIHPSHDVFFAGRHGTTSAIGLPNRVMRTGVPVVRTSSSTARQVALNFKIAISRIAHV